MSVVHDGTDGIEGKLPCPPTVAMLAGSGGSGSGAAPTGATGSFNLDFAAFCVFALLSGLSNAGMDTGELRDEFDGLFAANFGLVVFVELFELFEFFEAVDVAGAVGASELFELLEFVLRLVATGSRPGIFGLDVFCSLVVRCLWFACANRFASAMTASELSTVGIPPEIFFAPLILAAEALALLPVVGVLAPFSATGLEAATLSVTVLALLVLLGLGAAAALLSLGASCTAITGSPTTFLTFLAVFLLTMANPSLPVGAGVTTADCTPLVLTRFFSFSFSDLLFFFFGGSFSFSGVTTICLAGLVTTDCSNTGFSTSPFTISFSAWVAIVNFMSSFAGFLRLLVRCILQYPLAFSRT